MKRPITYLLTLISLLVVFQQCDNEATPTLPEIVTNPVLDIHDTSATSGGEILSDGDATITARGVCWSATSLPTIDNDKTEDGSGSGMFTSSLSGLGNGTTYLVRAYAINKVGIAYGNQLEFTTSATPTLPSVTTTLVSNITPNSATSGGNVTSDGNSLVTARGVCWSTTALPTINDSKTIDGIGEGVFVSALTSLSADITYYVRAYAANALGTAYGNEVFFSSNTITATVYAIQDATIFDTQAGGSTNANYGAGGDELLQVGFAAPSAMYARTLVQFDLSSIPSNAVIESARLQFTQGSSGLATSYILYVHKLAQTWVEGTTSFCTFNNACPTQGVPITPGGTDVTWNETSYSGTNANPWTTLGGTFNATATVSAVAGSSTIGAPYSFTADELKSDVQWWVTNSANNFGWILKTDFITTGSSMKRFYSREGAAASGNATTAPKLIITYH